MLFFFLIKPTFLIFFPQYNEYQIFLLYKDFIYFLSIDIKLSWENYFKKLKQIVNGQLSDNNKMHIKIYIYTVILNLY